MRIILLLIIFIFPLSLLSFEKRLTKLYSIDSVVYRSNISEGNSKVYFAFKNVPKDDKQLYSYAVDYSVDNGSDQTATLGKKNEFEVALTKGEHRFKIYYNSFYEEFDIPEIDFKSRHKTFVSLYLTKAEYLLIECDKPVIYVYPTQPTLVDVKVEPKGEFTFTYPPYQNGWKVNAESNGQLTHQGETYNYLFWESKQNWKPMSSVFESGFVVNKSEVISFLEDKLNTFGFNTKEKADFITYWGPQLIKNERNYIHFLFNEDCNEFADLAISPKPDNIYRFYMISMPLTETDEYNVPEQEIKTMERKGFTVLEWGGSEISKKQFQSDNEL